jgi:hypothetical protein
MSQVYTVVGFRTGRRPFYSTLSGINPASLTGHTYTTKPGGSLFFPALAIPTGKLKSPTWTSSTSASRGLMMPTRRQTRAADRAARNKWERGINEARIAAEAAREAARIAACNDPRPF